MLIQSIHFSFAPEDADKAEAILRELRDASRKEEGVTAFEVGRSQERPNVFALWEVYRDRAALRLPRGLGALQTAGDRRRAKAGPRTYRRDRLSHLIPSRAENSKGVQIERGARLSGQIDPQASPAHSCSAGGHSSGVPLAIRGAR